MRSERKLKTLIICLAVPLLVGAVSAIISREGMAAFAARVQPPLSPPAWLFPVVWTVLYLLMGYASYLVCTSASPDAKISGALFTYALQLAVNFLWSPIFFLWQNYLFAFLWLLVLWVLILITIIRFNSISRPAALLLVPYLLWVSFAGYLNFGVWLLNS